MSSSRVSAMTAIQTDHAWLTELSSIIAAAQEFRELPAFEVAFSCNGATVGVNVSTGSISNGSMASCAIVADEAVFEELVTGSTTLQRAYLSGAAQLSGEPEHLLRLALVFDACKRRSA